MTLNIDWSSVVQKIVAAAIVAGVLGIYFHVQETKMHTVALQQIRGSSWASCKLQYELAHKPWDPCYSRSAIEVAP